MQPQLLFVKRGRVDMITKEQIVFDEDHLVWRRGEPRVLVEQLVRKYKQRVHQCLHTFFGGNDHTLEKIPGVFWRELAPQMNHLPRVGRIMKL
jgi:hypothetical protein